MIISDLECVCWTGCPLSLSLSDAGHPWSGGKWLQGCHIVERRLSYKYVHGDPLHPHILRTPGLGFFFFSEKRGKNARNTDECVE